MKKLLLLALTAFGIFSCSQEGISETPEQINAKKNHAVDVNNPDTTSRTFENDSIIDSLGN
ncbi:MAG: hypothetical protein QM535_00765 [Limnohabitans sp.]|nr:hypothetical protein [Limnohabitans sp.]